MKQIIYGGINLFTVVMFFVLIASVGAAYIRGREAGELVSQALYVTASDAINEERLEPYSKKAWVSDFLENIIIAADDEIGLHVEVLSLDENKGIMSCAVKEEYSYANGTKGEREGKRTVIIDKEKVLSDPLYSLSFHMIVPTNLGEKDTIVNSYRLKEGTYCIMDNFPEIEGCWLEKVCFADGKKAEVKEYEGQKYVVDSSGERIGIYEDIDLYGIYKTE
ncbi:MAG: hypothetical protein K6E13_10645 [Lachnospiraceae bacterium]|nr:hypothetical protein [Lachnospiraceae bacterium]